MALPASPTVVVSRSAVDARRTTALVRRLGLCAALALALVPAVARAQLLSPGPLARSHQKVDSLSTCDKCHSDGGKRVPEETCLACHEKIKTARDAGRGYHTKLIKTSGKQCAQCHPDHQGRDFSLIRWDPKKAGFQHGETGWELKGGHEKVECNKCHKLPDHRYMITTDCVSCHKDIHVPSLDTKCAKCHDEKAWKPAPLFDHAKTKYPLEGKHAKVECIKCHPAAEKSLKFKGIAYAKCNDCHKDPHNGDREPTACARCHSVKGWKELPASVREDHAPGVFPLRGKHFATPCAACHKPGQPMKAAPTRCEACHESPHKAPLGNKCNTCHGESSWAQLTTPRFAHELTRYPLKGEHADVACAKCHPARGAYTHRFLGQKFDRCMRCHKDPHATSYTTVADAQRCEACHEERGFAPSTFTAARHVAPVYAIEGAHVAVPCASCHNPKAKLVSRPAASPAAGVATVAFAMHPQSADCALCHANPHGDNFKKEMAAGGCRGCHIAADWKLAKIDHDKTSFPLRGRHAQVACDACHTQQVGASGKRIFSGCQNECVGCHGDPHFGQFVATKPVKDCGACHGWDAWKQLKFDHNKDARMSLEGAHEKVKCEACHDKRKAGSTSAFVYRNGRIKCQACHDNHHERQGGDIWKEAGTGGGI